MHIIIIIQSIHIDNNIFSNTVHSSLLSYGRQLSPPPKQKEPRKLPTLSRVWERLWESLRDTNNRKCKELLIYKRGRNKFPNKLINGISFLVTISRLRLIIVYRPLYFAKHAVTTSTFFTDPFTVYLESLVMSSKSLIILGDFNIRMDLLPVGYTGVDGSQAACLSTTHELGHTLDLIITRTSDNIIAACPCIGELFSDHFPVFSQIRSKRPQSNVMHEIN